ncbi:MAG: hypothetical protein R3A51_21415 [Nannocystaceae bacterium]
MSTDDRVPAELAEICNRACHPEPAQRFPDVATLRAALLEYLAHRRATAVLRTASRQHERFRMLLDVVIAMRSLRRRSCQPPPSDHIDKA